MNGLKGVASMTKCGAPRTAAAAKAGRDAWTTTQILEAYRGQARVERAFRDLKNPWVGAFRPQYHWIDHKLVVHALLAVVALLLGRVLLRRAHAAGVQGSLRT
jgi:transposase